MQPADSLPSYEQLFGDLDFRERDESRSVYSPAAYLAELIQLLGDDAPAGLLADLLSRRPAIGNVPLDGAGTYTELPYLDVVNEVLEGELAQGQVTGADQVLRALRHPFTMPFSLRHERLRRLLHYLEVEPAELYRHLSDVPDSDVVAREYLGLIHEDVEVLTTPLGDGPALRGYWGLDSDAGETLSTLVAVSRFCQAASITGAELRELLYGGLGAASAGGAPAERSAASAFFVHHGGPVVGLDAEEERLVCVDDPANPYDDNEPIPAAWFDRVSRFVRLARRTGLAFMDLDLVLRDCCDNRIDARALRHLAVLLHLRRGLDVPVDVAVSLVARVNTLGAGDGDAPRDLFDRVFNVPFATAGAPVILGSARVPYGYAGRPVLACTGDILAARNKEYRGRVTAALSLTEDELAALVTRFGERSTSEGVAEPLPFDLSTGPAELSLLHRIHRLSTALGVSAGELLDVLDALECDPALQRHTTFPLLIDTGVGTDDYHAVLAGGDVASGLWLMQTLLAVVPWMQSADLNGQELATVLGAAAARAQATSNAQTGLDGQARSAQATSNAQEEPDADASLLAELRRRFEELAPSPELFTSRRFSRRAAVVVHDIAVAHPGGVVSRRDARLLRVDPARAASAAYTALSELGLVVGGDLEGIGLGDRLAAKVHTNLIIGGYLEPGGALPADRLPEAPSGLRLARDFSRHRDALFDLVRSLRPVPEPGDPLPEPAAFFPSDLARLAELGDAERAELYDNLVFNGYLDDEGTVLRPGFFARQENRATFAVSADLSGVTAAVHTRLRELAARFTGGAVAFDPAVLAALPLSSQQVAALVESLRFNGHIDADGFFADPAALLDPNLGELALALEFYPYRRHVLDALRGVLTKARAELLAVTQADFLDITDPAAAQRAADLLDGVHLADDRVLQAGQAFFADPAGRLELAGFTAAENSAIFRRIATCLADHRPYRIDPGASAEFGFDPGEQAQLVVRLVDAGHLTPELGVPEHRLGYFAEVYNALDFVLPGLEDFAKDVFFLLHAVAVRTNAAIAEVVAKLEALAARQRAALLAVLQDELGVTAPITAAACTAVAGDPDEAVELLAAPALAGAERGADLLPDSRAALRRIRAVALLAGKFGLDANQIALAFRDQDLAGKFPEPLAAPRGVDRIDALLESSDGNVYLFRGQECWVYGPGYVRTSDEPVQLTGLSPRFTGLTSVDAAFCDVNGTDWIIGRDNEGVARTFTRQRGGARWAPEQQEWGVVENAFDAPAAIDAAFTDEEGRVYLFCGDQYVRYSGPGRDHVDPGHPRRIGEWWEDGQRGVELPDRFRRSLDAAFRGTDGTTYLFSGDKFLAVEGTAAERPIADVWGRIRNTFAETGRIDAACADGAAYLVFSGDQVFRYSGDIESGELRADAGFPQLIELFLPGVPAEFAGGVEAAFRDSAGVLHLFKNGRTVALRQSGPDLATIAQRWGTLGAALPGGKVDAAFVGLDGRTYLFSGDRYLRYSGADYSTVDPGYPRRIADDWGGLLRVDAAFTLDGATHLFGTAGLITWIPLEHADDLDAGRLPHPVRRLLLEHGIVAAEDAPVSWAGPEWQVTADHGIRLTLRRAVDPAAVDPITGKRASGEQRIEVHCADPSDASFHVRYSTKDYTAPDAGHPQALASNRWNLPDALADAPFTRVDAAFTGRDGLVYLFSGGHYATFDNKRRWWSEPQPLLQRWDDLPFGQVDAALLGKDGRTYLFSGTSYVRYSTGDHTRIDDRYPATITRFWGNVVSSIARTGRVDATLVTDETDANGVVLTHTYLFSGNQYVRYTGTDLSTPDLGYPQVLAALPHEPRLGNLKEAPTVVDAAFADRGTVYLFGGGRCQAVSQTAYRRYENAFTEPVRCAFDQDGTLLAEKPSGWHLHGQPERQAVEPRQARPRFPRTVPPEFRTDLDAVLHGADGNTYLFKGASCFDTRLGRAYPLAEEWGRPRNNVVHDNAVDAAFVGTDGRTYLFSGDQFVVYAGPAAMDADVEGAPLPISAHWGGLTRVTLAYVQGGTTYLFEPPRPDGTMRYVTYTGRDYTRAPEGGVPRVADAGFWGMPEEYRPAGFTVPDAVLSVGETMLLLFDGQYVRRDPAGPAGTTSAGPVTGAWSQPRPLERAWRGLTEADGLTSAFVGRDGATYFFFPGEFARHDSTLAARRPIRDAWGRTRNNFLGTGDDVVDAAFADTSADGSRVTYLFSGDQYVRYTGASYRYADSGYPKSIAGNLRAEEAFSGLPVSFDEDLADRLEADGRSMVDAVAGSGRTVRILSGRVCHVLSRGLTARFDQTALARVRNTVAERQRVDAALLISGETPRTLLFSGDQYVRYSDVGGYDQVDEGYPRVIAESLPDELDIDELPESFRDAIDAAFQDADGVVYLFAGTRYLRIDGDQVTEAPIAGAWGVVDNAFRAPGATVEAAFTSREGDLYVFCGGQYARYRMTLLEKVEDGYPRPVAGDWGNLPETFDAGPDAAFSFEGRAYLCLGTEHVRYSGGRYDTPDRTYPQPFRHRWSGTADFRLSDIRTIAGFAELARAHPGDLAAFLLPGEAAVEDPYRYLADLFGWDAEEIRWCRRRVGLLTDGAADESLFELEFLIRIAGLFAFTGRLGTVPSALHADGGDPALEAAAEALQGLLARRNDPADWPALKRTLHDELNVLRRNALVAAILARSPGDRLRTPRDLFDRFLIDVEMGPRGNTSRVREAIAAVQLYVHRYLLSLESPPPAKAIAATAPVKPAGVVESAEDARRRIREWWQWMRGYRLWEANRKVFLYPENYIRPELRADRTPAFRALEGDLLQNEITATAVEQAYKRYLDEYTEVSRLTIAGGYVYTKDRTTGGPYRLALFGRTKTDPRRYYHRRAEFTSRDRLSASWEPWQKVNLQIDADEVHPVHAFGRTFVFWAAVEPVADDGATTTVVAASKGSEQQVSGKPPTRQIKIFYSFENLNKEWVAAQTLGVGAPRSGTIDGITLFIQPVAAGEDRTSIMVACAYTVTTPNPPADDGKAKDPTVQRTGLMFSLSSELVAEDLTERALADIPGFSELPFGIFFGDVLKVLAGMWVAGETDDKVAQALAAASKRVAEIFVDTVKPADVVRFDTPVAAESGSWFSVDVKGGSFLCRPTDAGADESAGLLPLLGNGEGLPVWSQVDAAVELPGGARYFFDNTTGQYAESVPGKVPDGAPAGTRAGTLSGRLTTTARWGLVPTVLPKADKVDTVLSRGQYTYVFSGQRYVRFTGTPFQVIDDEYPKNIKTNKEGLPPWTKVDVAFTTPDGVEYFVSHSLGRYLTSEDIAAAAAKNPPEPPADHPLAELWALKQLPNSFKPLDAVLVNGRFAVALAGEAYARFTWTTETHGERKESRFVLDDLGKDDKYPHPLNGNKMGLPGTRVSAAAWRDNITYFFDNGDNGTAGGTGSGFYRKILANGSTTQHKISATTRLASTGKVGAAYARDGKLYLTSGPEYVRYTLGGDGLPGRLVDKDYPKPLNKEINTAFTRGDQVYLFSGATYARGEADSGPDEAGEYLPVAGAWGGLPRESHPPFDAAMDSDEGLFLFVGDSYARRAKTAAVPRPYERTTLPFEIIRLTTGTAFVLNERLLSGGVAALLDTATQESDEVAVTTGFEAATAVRVREGTVDEGRLPTSKHLDFQSANGIYYWEIFFHAPLLIAQALNEAQRFEDAKRWYEYVFDPTNPHGHWRFLPFLGADLRALADGCARDLEVLTELGVTVTTVEAAGLTDVLAALRRLAAADTGDGRPGEGDLLTVTDEATHQAIAAAVTALAATKGLTPGQAAAVAALGERTAVLADLEKQLQALGGRADLLQAYREDPFDPHAIARLRPVAYRRAVVMGYIDNLLDWGDMLFRQYTPESVDEARMLYILAFDLLGEPPERLGTALPSLPRSFTELNEQAADLDLLGYLTGGGSLLEQAGEVHAGVADSYFHIPDNSLFTEYWDRVGDRLRKIRDSLNILGISQPLPLFEPPLDPMRLVRAAAMGIPLGEAAAAATAATVPPQRFSVAFRRAQELVDRVRQFGADLLGVLERRDAEELSVLQVKQEGTILGLTLGVRRAQVRIADEDLAELQASLSSAEGRSDHYGDLIETGLSPAEHGQLAMMSLGATLNFVAAIFKTGAAFAYPAPQVKVGPFILGTEWGGEQVGRALDKAGEVSESSAEGLSMIGEALGVRAQHERSVEDWKLQLAIADSDQVQIGHQINAAQQRLESARQELKSLEQEIANNASTATFMRDKFTGAELYGWLSARLSGLCFQAYELAYDAARSAEAAYRFERGVRDSEAELIRPAYWESRRSGLQAAESLGMDLERLGQAYLTGNVRGLEITTKLSLVELDPVALLRLRSGGRCEFTLGEDVFDRNFPGHFLRQLRTVSVTFTNAAGEQLGLNATLTQLGSKTVLEADPKAVKYLLDPQGEPPATLRGDWRPSQRIALSQVEYPMENNGLFELRYDDERYLPFEGTGAVSTWRLELGGGSQGANALTDVVLTVRYTAEYGGDVFTESVKGMLRPYPVAHLIDVARDFPKEWAAFLGGGDRLVLPLSPDLFPGMSSRRITGLYPKYEYAGEATARLVLETGRRLPLADGVPLTTPGLSLNGGGPSNWAFTVEGPRTALSNVTLVLMYQAAVS